MGCSPELSQSFGNGSLKFPLVDNQRLELGSFSPRSPRGPGDGSLIPPSDKPTPAPVQPVINIAPPEAQYDQAGDEGRDTPNFPGISPTQATDASELPMPSGDIPQINMELPSPRSPQPTSPRSVGQTMADMVAQQKAHQQPVQSSHSYHDVPLRRNESRPQEGVVLRMDVSHVNLGRQAGMPAPRASSPPRKPKSVPTSRSISPRSGPGSVANSHSPRSERDVSPGCRKGSISPARHRDSLRKQISPQRNGRLAAPAGPYGQQYEVEQEPSGIRSPQFGVEEAAMDGIHSGHSPPRRSR